MLSAGYWIYLNHILPSLKKILEYESSSYLGSEFPVSSDSQLLTPGEALTPPGQCRLSHTAASPTPRLSFCPPAVEQWPSHPGCTPGTTLHRAVTEAALQRLSDHQPPLRLRMEESGGNENLTWIPSLAKSLLQALPKFFLLSPYCFPVFSECSTRSPLYIPLELCPCSIYPSIPAELLHRVNNFFNKVSSMAPWQMLSLLMKALKLFTHL